MTKLPDNVFLRTYPVIEWHMTLFILLGGFSTFQTVACYLSVVVVTSWLSSL